MSEWVIHGEASGEMIECRSCCSSPLLLRRLIPAPSCRSLTPLSSRLSTHQAEELYPGLEGQSLRQEYRRMLEAVGRAARQTFEKFEQAVKEQPAAEEGAAAAGGGGGDIAANSAGLSGVAGRQNGRIKGGFFSGWTK